MSEHEIEALIGPRDIELGMLEQEEERTTSCVPGLLILQEEAARRQRERESRA